MKRSKPQDKSILADASFFNLLLYMAIMAIMISLFSCTSGYSGNRRVTSKDVIIDSFKTAAPDSMYYRVYELIALDEPPYLHNSMYTDIVKMETGFKVSDTVFADGRSWVIKSIP